MHLNVINGIPLVVWEGNVKPRFGTEKPDHRLFCQRNFTHFRNPNEFKLIQKLVFN